MWLLVLVTTACRVESDDCNTRYQCHDICPCGQRCVEGECVPPADAGALGDAGGEGGTDSGGGTDASDASDGSEGTDANAEICERTFGDNDSCATAADLTDDLAEGITVYGDTRGYDGNLTPAVPVDCTGSSEAGPDAVYRMDLVAGDTLSVELRAHGGWDASVYLLDGCKMLADCLGGSDSLGDAIETFDATITKSGTYFLIVDASGASAAGCFELIVSKT